MPGFNPLTNKIFPFLTALHVVNRILAEGEELVVVTCQGAESPEYETHEILRFEAHQDGFDLAIGEADCRSSSYVSIVGGEMALAQGVCTYGFPFTEGIQDLQGTRQWNIQARYFEGYITREVVYPHPGYRNTESYEVNFPAPSGLSGSPLLLAGSSGAIGVIYGNLESYTIADEREILPESGAVVSEVRKVVQFGLAHRNDTLLGIRASFLSGKSLLEWTP